MRKSDIFEMDGEAHTAADWCAIKGITIQCFRHRWNRGLSIEECLCEQVRGRKEPPKKEQRSDANCVDCEYSMLLSIDKSGYWHVCDYLGRVGKCRPCEYGLNCTVKKTKGKGGERRRERGKSR